MKKTILCLLLALGLLLLSAAAMADDDISYSIDDGNITIMDGADEGTLRIQQGSNVVDNIDPGTTIYVGGACSTNLTQLIVNAKVPVKITYAVALPETRFHSVISIADYSDVTLTLDKDPCSVYGNPSQPGIELGSGSKLTIQRKNSNDSLFIYGGQSAILGPSSDETPATVILNSGIVAIIPESDSGISGNVNLVINGGTFIAYGKDIDVNSLIITGGELWTYNASYGTKVTYDNLKNYENQITCEGGILPNSVDYYIELVVFGELTLPVDLTIPDGKKLFLFSDSSLTIPDDRSLTCNGVNIYTDSTLTNEGTLTLNQSSMLGGELTNKGTLIINSDLFMLEGGDLGTLTNTGTISGTGFINPRLSQSQPTSLTIDIIENGTVTLKADGQGKTALEYSADGNSWTENPVFTVVIPDAGQTFHARFKADDHFYQASDKIDITVYPVSLNANGGTINSGDLTGYTYGEGATLPTDVTRAGYTFAGWYDNAALTGSPVTQIGATETGAKEYWARWVVVLTDPDGEIVSGDAAFAKLPPVTVPTLVLPEGTTLGGSVMLKYVKVDTTRENTAIYDVYLVDQDGNRVKLPAACTLCLPYPEGLNQNSASTYRIHILHEMDGGRSEDFDSVSGGLELTAQGLCVRISSLSPFTITWERFPEVNLPQTGDSSHPGLWLALGLLSIAALAALALRGRKSRAH